jgi:hypothetical protein
LVLKFGEDERPGLLRRLHGAAGAGPALVLPTAPGEDRRERHPGGA